MNNTMYVRVNVKPDRKHYGLLKGYLDVTTDLNEAEAFIEGAKKKQLNFIKKLVHEGGIIPETAKVISKSIKEMPIEYSETGESLSSMLSYEDIVERETPGVVSILGASKLVPLSLFSNYHFFKMDNPQLMGYDELRYGLRVYSTDFGEIGASFELLDGDERYDLASIEEFLGRKDEFCLFQSELSRKIKSSELNFHDLVKPIYVLSKAYGFEADREQFSFAQYGKLY